MKIDSCRRNEERSEASKDWDGNIFLSTSQPSPREAGIPHREASHRWTKDASLDGAPYVIRITICATARCWRLPEIGSSVQKTFQ